MRINSVNNQNIKGRAIYVEPNKKQFLDLTILQHRDTLSDIPNVIIKKINKIIENKDFDLFIIRGKRENGEYLLTANTNFQNVMSSYPCYAIPRVSNRFERDAMGNDTFLYAANDAIMQFQNNSMSICEKEPGFFQRLLGKIIRK